MKYLNQSSAPSTLVPMAIILKEEIKRPFLKHTQSAISETKELQGFIDGSHHLYTNSFVFFTFWNFWVVRNSPPSLNDAIRAFHIWLKPHSSYLIDWEMSPSEFGCGEQF